MAESDARLQALTNDYRNLEDELERANTELVALEERLADSESEWEALESWASEAEQQRELSEVRTARDELDAELSEVRTAHKALRRGRLDVDDPQAEYDTIVSDLRREQSLVTRVQGGTLYTVQSGETLGNVARRYYGDARRWPTIYQANQHIIENPDKVVPGLTVILP